MKNITGIPIYSKIKANTVIIAPHQVLNFLLLILQHVYIIMRRYAGVNAIFTNISNGNPKHRSNKN